MKHSLRELDIRIFTGRKSLEMPPSAEYLHILKKWGLSAKICSKHLLLRVFVSINLGRFGQISFRCLYSTFGTMLLHGWTWNLVYFLRISKNQSDCQFFFRKRGFKQIFDWSSHPLNIWGLQCVLQIEIFYLTSRISGVQKPNKSFLFFFSSYSWRFFWLTTWQYEQQKNIWQPF